MSGDKHEHRWSQLACDCGARIDGGWDPVAEGLADLRARLAKAALTLSEDELRVVTLLTERFAGAGMRSYGHLHLATDKRDFVEEGLAEAVDLCFYLACERVKRTR